MDRTDRPKSQNATSAESLRSPDFAEIGKSSDLILPITIDELADAVKALHAVTLRDAPHFRQVQDLHQQLETAYRLSTRLSTQEEQDLIRTGSALLVDHIAMLERARYTPLLMN
jgi:hypothetical protein